MSLLNNLIKSENYMCIYRNFMLMKNYQKIIVLIRIFLELCATIIIITHKIFFRDLGNVVSSLLFVPYCYQALVLLKNLVIVVGSVLNSKSFLIVNEKTRVLHNRFRNEPSYSKSVKILNLKCSVISIAFLILVFIVIIIRIYIISFNKDRFNKGRVVIIILFEAWVDVRFMLEHLVIYTVITLIYDFLKCLNNYVYEDLKKYNIDTKDEEVHLDEQFNETADKLTVWTEVYQDILSCTKNTSICFNELVIKYEFI
ncbi:hypothetical protein B5X24_HaOG200754 [Helicoverpa armigera]|nr:hypothetical protein B5X24_HaOG200754 [Helicoverpa armigera]